MLIDCNQAFLDFMARRQRGPGVGVYRPVCPSNNRPLGQGNTAWWDAQVRAATWRSPGVEVPDDEGNSPASSPLSRDITGLRTTQAQLQQEQHYDS